MEITKEQFMEWIKGDDGKAIFAEAVKALGYGDTTGLDNKNRELLAELRKIKDSKAEIEKALEPFKGLDPDEVKKAIEATKNPPKAGDITDDPRWKNVESQMKQLRSDLDKANDEKKQAKSRLEDKEKTDRIRAAIKDGGFDPAYEEALGLIFGRKAQLRQNDTGDYSVVVDEGTSVVDISEYAKNFAKQDAGKPYLPKQQNSSQNASRYNGAMTGVKKINLSQLNAMPPKERAVFMENNKGIQVTDE